MDSVIRQLRHNPVTFITNLAREYGDLVRIPFGSRDLYLINDPDFIRRMFLDPPGTFAKRADPAAEQTYLRDIGGFTPLFHGNRIPGYAATIAEAAARADVRWRAEASISKPFEVDIYREMGRITLEVVIQTLFRTDAQADAAGLFDAMLAMNVGYGFDPIEATLGSLMPAQERPMDVAQQCARAQIQSYVEQLATLDKRRAISHSYMAMLLENLAAGPAIQAAMSVMLAMHEVTATTLPWAWYLLSQNPEAERKLHSEIDSMLEGRPPRFEDLQSLPYTNMVLEEARRLYPVVWIVGRFVREDVWFGADRVPAGSVVLASQQLMHHDSRYYSEPERFDPDRWTPDAVATRPEFCYFPFSAGPRACAGEMLARTQDAMILATLAQHWRAAVCPGRQPKPVPQQSSAPRAGIQMTLAAI